jgi:septum formation protein
MPFSFISRDYPLILASSSPRRKRLLRQIALPFRSLTSHIDEDLLAAKTPLRAHALAERKAAAVHRRSGERWILGADTQVVLGRRVLGKPSDPDEARSTLALLSGKEHRVITGFCLLDPSGHPAHAEDVVTLVRMKRLTEEEINAYVATGEPFGKAGSYAIQGTGAFLVEGISGSYTNVVGLPLCAVIKAMLAARALRSFPLSP